MKIVKLEVGNLGTNCFIVYDETSRLAAVVDPGGSADEILRFIARESLQVEKILLTHGHADHIMAVDKVKAATGAKLYVHEADAPMLASASLNLSGFMGQGFTVSEPDFFLRDGETVSVGSIVFQVLHTPGHTPGGVCFVAEEIAICGDTLFAESIGRTDFPGGSYKQLIESIKTKLLCLPDQYKVLPGHGPDTTIGWERERNPFIQ